MTDWSRGKVALVTGSGQGIGKAIARKLLELGMKVVIADVDGDAAEETASEFGTIGPAAAVGVDVANEDGVAKLMERTLSEFGHLDALVNNAGRASPHSAPVERLELTDWEQVIGTNLTGVFLCTKHAVPALRRNRGAIVNIGSTPAVQSEPHTEAYSASKGGVVALTHALAMSLGPEVRVNCISPGWIAVDDWKKGAKRKPPKLRPEDHEQHPAGRVGRPADIADLAAFLLSPEAGFITGQHFLADGGMTRKMIYIE